MYTLFGVGAFQSLIFSLLLLTKKGKKDADKFLAGFFFIVALYLANVFSVKYELWQRYPEIVLIITFIKITYGPLLYFYVLSLLGNHITKRKLLLHLIPIIITYLSILPFIFLTDDQKLQYFNDRFINLPIHISIATFLAYFLAPCYFIGVITLIRKHRKYLKDNHSSIDAISLSWMHKLLVGVISIWMLDNLNAFALNYTNYNIENGTKISFFIKLVFIFFIVLIGYYGIRQGTVFASAIKPDKKNNIPEPDSDPTEENIKALVAHLRNQKTESDTRIQDIAMNLNIPIHVLSYITQVKVEKAENFEIQEKPKLIPDDIAIKHLDTLQRYMQTEKAYLNNELLIQDVAVKLDIPTHHISYIINSKLNQNFYDFVNQFRIKEVKRRLCDPAHGNITIVGMAFDCGFNSKATFNRLFKKYTGLTPSQYKCVNK